MAALSYWHTFWKQVRIAALHYTSLPHCLAYTKCVFPMLYVGAGVETRYAHQALVVGQRVLSKLSGLVFHGALVRLQGFSRIHFFPVIIHVLYPVLQRNITR